MSRASLRDNSTSVSLFPFLAVLLCTMGSLLLLLVVMTKVSREQAARRAEAEVAAEAAPNDVDAASEQADRERLQNVNAYVSHLNKVRGEAERRLREEQLRLSHIEDHMRRLVTQLEALQLAAAELDALEEVHFDDHEQAEREIARLQDLIADTREQIDALREEQANKPRSYAIVPYEGKYGTRRRPIYIECREDVVLIQPEGVELDENDFHPPLGAGNPLAAALRAVRENMIRDNPAMGRTENSEPYPLIIVRPDGIPNYYRVRRAIESWDADFGYEFVDGDWNLEYPPANPQVAAVAQQAIDLARARRRLLAAAAPRAFGRTRGVSGDLDYNGGGYGSGRYSGDETGEGSTEGGAGEGRGNFNTGEPAENDGTPQQATSPSGDPSTGSDGPALTFDPRGPAGEADQLAAAEMRDGQTSGNSPGDAGGPGESPAQPRSGRGQASGQQGPSYVNLGSIPNRPAPPDGQDGAQPSAGDEGMSLADGQPGASGPPGGASGGSPSPTGGGAAPGQPSTPSVSVVTGNQGPPQSMAATRGDNWGVENGGRNAVPIRRAVQIIVRKDRLSILPERESSADAGTIITGGREVVIEGQLQYSVDRFVSALQEHIRNWGIAGDGLYWRPVLMLNVGPDGEQRAEELAVLLEGSGIDVRNASTARRQEGVEANATY